jgi:putative methionine-R-sulfoxide reductase with GAF domain
MDRQSILGINTVEQPARDMASTAKASATLLEISNPLPRVQFPGEDQGKSLAEMALRDLDATLRLLVDRAQYITGASGAAIALREGDEMICRARSGSSAPELGAQLQVNSGLTGESVRTKKMLRCDDVEADLRVNRESCRALGITSVIVMPLTREEEVFGVFELFSGRAHVFEERDIIAVQRLGEMIQTAVEHAEAAIHAQDEIAEKKASPQENPEVESIKQNNLLQNKAAIRAEPATSDAGHVSTSAVPAGSVGKCATCGFPVSEGRKLCLDCETAQSLGETSVSGPNTPAFLSQYSAEAQEKNWVRRHFYWIGAIAIGGATVALLWLHF